MSKQIFTVGQVLTAAQMTTLQANDYNQTVSAKVASYVLVAADAGTRITMSNAAATTVTVNTALFTAGDTLTITNIGAGVCTITAGTATVSTAGSLALNQYDSGTLYFTSTGVSIWNGANPGDITSVVAGTGLTGGASSGAATLAIDTAVTVDKTTAQTLTNKTLTSPALTTPTISTLTTNGDLVYGTGSGALSRLGIGSSAQVLTVTGGVPVWATAGGGGGMTLLSTTSLTGSSVTVSSIDQTYNNLYFVILNAYISVDEYVKLQFNGDTTAGNHLSFSTRLRSTGASLSLDGTTELTSSGPDNQAKPNIITGIICNYTSATYHYCQTNASLFTDALNFGLSVGQVSYFGTSAITSLKFYTTAGTFSAGTVAIYGVK